MTIANTSGAPSTRTQLPPTAEPVVTSPVQLGARLTADGVDVAVLASHADAVDLCLLDPAPAGGFTERRFRLLRGPHGIW